MNRYRWYAGFSRVRHELPRNKQTRLPTITAGVDPETQRAAGAIAAGRAVAAAETSPSSAITISVRSADMRTGYPPSVRSSGLDSVRD